MIMGPPGSGKSTLARALGERLGLPVHHLDQAYWREGWVRASDDDFRAEAERLAALPAWIIDGNYTMAIEARLAAADTLVFLDTPTWVAMARVIWRIATSYGRVRPDAADGCPERFDADFLRFALDWNRTRRRRGLDMVEAFTGRKVVIRNAADRRALLAG
jgi:adenylate kinase family enzyme